MHNILLMDADKGMLSLTSSELMATQKTAIAEIMARAEHVAEIPDGWLRNKILTAGNLLTAQSLLQSEEVSVVFINTLSLEIESIQLMLHLKRSYPHIPLVVFTNAIPTFTDREMKHHVVSHYIERPYNVSMIQLRIFEILLIRILDPEFVFDSGVGLPSLLQLIYLGSLACTLRLQCDEQSGFISFLPGNLVDAGCNDLSGEAAMLELLNWKDATIYIQAGSSTQTDLILKPLPKILAAHFENISMDQPEEVARKIRKIKEFLQYLLAGINRRDPKRRRPSLFGVWRGFTKVEK
ncbi:MAG: DUF4388 domain-containing protein [Candidatus Cloacimonetes bacterium]|nr:DUF4388 domain-containing protein [Candidatus Cloacimonadota bacterium]